MTAPVVQAPTPSLAEWPEQVSGTASVQHQSTYREILTSTSLIGASSVINILFALVRNKVMAVLLGPAGFGLMGVYSTIADLTQSAAGLGIQNSGVRQIAEAAGCGETHRIARTATVLKQMSLLLGLVGGVLLVTLSGVASHVTFSSERHAAGIAVLGLAVFFRMVAAGHGALIQGLRRISDLARMNVLAAAFGTAASIPIVYLFREQGIVPSLVAVAAASTLTSWWYSRKVRIDSVLLGVPERMREAAALLKLGMAFLASGFLTIAAAYAIRLIVLRSEGFEAAGVYQAAWTLGGLYVAFILQAMGADFYPRLTAVSHDHAESNRLVNEQAQISLLLAGPGVIATLTFASLVVALLYSTEFDAAVRPLRWICLGMMLRVIAWPMGFIVIAKGAQQLFFWTEVAATVVHVGLAWWLIAPFGVEGAGAAFFGLYVWHGLLIYAIVRKITRFRWSAANSTLAMLFLPLTGLVFCSFYLLPSWLATLAGIATTVLSGAYSTRALLKLIPADSVPASLWLLRAGLTGPLVRRGANGH